jgi:cell division protein FtsB
MSNPNPHKSVFRKLFLNKYVAVVLVFTVFVTFFDEHNLIHRWQSYQRIREMRKEMQFYQDEIKTTKQKKMELQSSDENLEKFAREHYYLKKDNEDVFIIKENETVSK